MHFSLCQTAGRVPAHTPDVFIGEISAKFEWNLSEFRMPDRAIYTLFFVIRINLSKMSLNILNFFDFEAQKILKK